MYSLHKKIQELEKHVEYEAFDKREGVMWKELESTTIPPGKHRFSSDHRS